MILRSGRLLATDKRNIVENFNPVVTDVMWIQEMLIDGGVTSGSWSLKIGESALYGYFY
jgi:hypothetical protein